MDRDLPLIPTILFLACLIAAILVYMNNVQRLHPPLISQIYSDSNGDVWAMYKNQIMPIEHTYYDSLVTGYSLDKHNIDNHVGQAITLSSGHFILNRGGQKTSLIQKIERFLRKKERASKAELSSLIKCDPGFLECRSWGERTLNFDTAVSGLELSNGHIIINDTARHQIYLVDRDGAILNKQEGFRFPNDAKQIGEKLWVVDTNNNRLVSFNIEGDNLIRSQEMINLSIRDDIDKRHRFPSIAEKFKSTWIILSNENGMDHPGIYQIDGDTTRRLLPSLNDISAIHVKGSSLYAADYESLKIWKLDIDSGVQTELAGPAIEFMHDKIDAEIEQSKGNVYTQIGLILFAGLLALIFSIRRSKPNSHYGDALGSEQDIEKSKILNDFTYPLWVEKNQWHLKRIKLAEKLIVPCLIALVLLSLVTGVVAVISGGILSAAKLIFSMLIFITIFSFVLRAIVKPRNSNYVDKALGTNGTTIMVKDLKTQEIEVFDLSSTYWTNYELYSKESGWIFWGNNAQKLYIADEINRHIIPLLKNENRLTLGKMMTYKLMNREKVTQMEVFGFSFIAIGLIIYHIFS